MKKSRLASFKRQLRSLDMFAIPITLTFKGKDRFRSMWGGLVTTLIVLFFLAVIAFRLYDLIMLNQTQLRRSTIVASGTTVVPPVSLSSSNTIAFMISDQYGNTSIDNP